MRTALLAFEAIKKAVPQGLRLTINLFIAVFQTFCAPKKATSQFFKHDVVPQSDEHHG